MGESIMKRILPLIGLTTLAVGAVVGVSSIKPQTKEAKAQEPEYTTFVPLTDGYIEATDGSAGKSVDDLKRGRNERFWSGGSGFDSQERTFNSNDDFIDTIHRAGGEGWRGNYRTPEIKLVDDDHRYISFLFGGGAGSDIFFNVWHERNKDGSQTFPEGYNRNVIEGQQTFFDNTGHYDSEDPDKLNAPISCNMTFRYCYIPDSVKVGDYFRLFVRDGKTSDYGGFTLGDIHVNQTLEDVAKSFSAHKIQMELNKYTSDWNENAIDYVLNFYANNSYYAAVRAAEASLTDADNNFDVNDHLSNWAYDWQFSSAIINFNGIISDNDAKDWTERMPANKSDNRYINADVSGIGESEKYRIISNEFTLSGTGFISAKLGGGTAVMSLIDNTGAELVSSRVAAAEGTNILNGAFIDAGVANIMTSGARLNTMSRTYLDASAHLGKRVRVVLSDERTGGNWGLAYFDEVVTKYTSLPTLKVDKIQQQFGENPLYHGVVTDKYFGDKTTTFGKAYDFVQSYYGVMRSSSNGQSYCDVIDTTDVQNLITAYEALDSDVKALVDAAQDYDFGSSATSENWYLAEANLSFTIGQTMITLVAQNSGSVVKVGFQTQDNNNVWIIVAISMISFATLMFFVLKKKKQEN